MALSQIECLKEQQVRLRVTESRPEFLYSEEQRLALETLLDEGPSCFQEFIETNRVRAFLSDLELARLRASVEPSFAVFPEDSDRGDGDGAGTRVSLQYWPERSKRALPRLELGWPQRATYRGATRVAVHAQPPLPGDPHVKEVIRRSIAQAQKVIAVVMDLFTDVDIFKDLLHASFKRNVAVYIILEVTGVSHFLKMCESAAMHMGHLKNLRVRSIRGTGFFTHSSKKVCGSQSQKFMVVDGDKAVSGSYSFTWTASRLDRSIITVLTGLAVDVFDQLFQDLYMMSDAVNLNKINLDKEQKLEPISTNAAPAVQLSAITALKLINPKYALVSGNAAARRNHADPETCTSKSNGMKRMKDMPDGPHVHPGLLYLEKANMIDYLPVWPEPDPPSDVIGFINIRDCNKPLQPHLTRSELFEVSRAIRFKDPPHMSCESLSEKVCARSTSPAASSYEKPLMQHQIRPGESNNQLSQEKPQPSSLEKQSICLSPISNPKPAHSNKKIDKDSSVDHNIGKQTDLLPEQREDTDVNNILASASAKPGKNSQIFGDNHNTPLPCPGSNTAENIGETSNKYTQDNHWNTHKLRETRTNETDSTDCTIQNKHSILSESSSSFSSEEYFECSEAVNGDSELIVTDNGMSAVSRYADERKTGTEPLSLLTSGLFETASSCELKKDTEESRLHSASPEECDDQQVTDVTDDKTPGLKLTSANGRNGSSESVPIARKVQKQETESTLQHGTESELIGQVKIDAQEHESNSIVDHKFNMQPVEINNSADSQLRINWSPYGPVRKVAAKQCIVFSDPVGKVPRLGLNPETCQRLDYKSSLKSEREVNDGTKSKPQVKLASRNIGGPGTENSHKEDSRLTFYESKKLSKLTMSKVEQTIEDKDTESSTLELKESAADEILDEAQQLKPKTLTGCRVGQLSVDIDPSKRKTLEHRRVQRENKNKPGVNNKSERNVMKLQPVSLQPPTQVTIGSTKATFTSLHPLTTSVVSTLGVLDDPPGGQSGQNRAANDLRVTPAKLARRHTAPVRSNQTRLRPLQSERRYSSEKQPQALQDRPRTDQLHQCTSFRQRSASTTVVRSSFRGASFPKPLRILKERTAGFSSQMNQAKTQSIKERDKK